MSNAHPEEAGVFLRSRKNIDCTSLQGCYPCNGCNYNHGIKVHNELQDNWSLNWNLRGRHSVVTPSDAYLAMPARPPSINSPNQWLNEASVHVRYLDIASLLCQCNDMDVYPRDGCGDIYPTSAAFVSQEAFSGEPVQPPSSHVSVTGFGALIPGSMPPGKGRGGLKGAISETRSALVGQATLKARVVPDNDIS